MKKLLVFLLGMALLTPVFVSAAGTSNSDAVATLQSQIAALNAQIQALQKQLAEIQGGGGTTRWCHDFNKNIRFGDYGDEVSALQTVLRKEGFAINEIENTFSEAVGSAVSGFQQKYRDEVLKPVGLAYGSGFVGTYTRAKLNQLYGCGITQPPIYGKIYMTAGSDLVGAIGQYASFTFKAFGGSGKYYIQVIDGDIPGLGNYSNNEPDKITLAGTPTKSGSFNVVFSVQDLNDKSLYGKEKFTVTIKDRGTQSSITVISPNGGEVWQVSDIYSIGYKFGNWDKSSVLVYLDQDYPAGSTKTGTNSSALIAERAANDSGSFTYMVPTYQAPGSGYRIRVCSKDMSVCDSSDAPFSIVATGSVKSMVFKDIQKIVGVSPYSVANLGFGVKEVSAQYNLGSYHQGRWYEGLNPGISGPVWVEFGWPNSSQVDATLLDENGQQRTIYLPATGLNRYPDGSTSAWFYWIAEDGSSYYARKDHGFGWPDLSVGESLVSAHLARKAGISIQPSITVTSPNGGEVWQVGSTQTIKWSGGNTTDRMRIILDTSPNFAYSQIADVTNTGSYNWVVPNIIAKFYVRVCTLTLSNLPNQCDTSDSPFSIVAGTQSLLTAYSATLIGNQSTYVAGQTIKFSVKGVASDGSAGVPGKGFNVQAWMQNSNFQTVQINGAYQSFNANYNSSTGYWDVTMTAPSDTSQTYKIEAAFYCSNSSSGCSSGQINKSFTFTVPSATQPSITVTSPNGGEMWQVGTTQTVKWTTQSLSSSAFVNIEIQKGSTVVKRYASIMNDGNELIVVPSDLQAGADYKVNVIYYFNSSQGVIDSSDSSFSIVAGTTAVVPSQSADLASALDSMRATLLQMQNALGSF